MYRILYFKWHLSDDVCHYAKLYTDRQPPAQEVLNFLSNRVVIDFFEFDLTDSNSQLLYSELFASTTPIECGEYQAAYQRAFTHAFDLYINGQKQSLKYL